MFARDHRQQTWTALTAAPLDLLVVGGGIAGAGIAREDARLGLRVNLVEQHDFAWGASSRSSKLVHGGLRYLGEGHVRLTRASVRERKRLLEEGPGLSDPLGFLLATYKGGMPCRRMYGARLTFRRIARDALKAARKHIPEMHEPNADLPVLSPLNLPLGHSDLCEAERRRLLGRYGIRAPEVVQAARSGELEHLPGASTVWAELRWAARAEGVVRLDDLLLRRTRLGLLLAQGGEEIMDRVGEICREELGWNHATWKAEATAYRRLWREHYSLPDRPTIPDWCGLLAEAKEARSTRAIARRLRHRRRWVRGGVASGAVASASLLFGLGRWAWRRRRGTARG